MNTQEIEAGFLTHAVKKPARIRGAIRTLGMTGDWFTTQEHQAIFEAICAGLHESQEPSTLQIQGHLRASKTIEDAFSRMLKGHVDDHVGELGLLLRRAFIKRRAGELLARSQDELGKESPDLVIAGLIKDLHLLHTPIGTVKHAKDYVDLIKANRADAKRGDTIGVRSRWFPVNQAIKRYRRMTMIGARPKVGKTIFVTNEATYTAQLCAPGQFVDIVSLEMSGEELTERIAADIGGLDLDHLDSDDVTAEEMNQFEAALETTRKLPIRFHDNATTSPQIVSSFYDAVSQGSVLGVVDYIQMITPDRRHENRAQEVGAWSTALAQCSKATNLPLLVTSQLSRASDQGQPRKPRLSDLRDSGVLEQDAFRVFLLHNPNPESYDRRSDTEVDLYLEANRRGPKAYIPMVLKKKLLHFEPKT